MLVQMLAGSFAATENELGGAKSPAKGAFLLVINPLLLSKFYEDDMEVWISHYLEAGGGAGSRYPGMNASSIETERKTDGIPVPDGLLREFEKIGSRSGVPFDLIPINTKTDTGTT